MLQFFQTSKILSSCLQEQVKLKESALAAVREGTQAELNLITQSSRATEAKLAKVLAPSDAYDNVIVSPHALCGNAAIYLINCCWCRAASSISYQWSLPGH